VISIYIFYIRCILHDKSNVLRKMVDTSNCVRRVFTFCIKCMLILMDKIIAGNVFVISGRL
jgi:hypothetical protein